MSISNSPSPGFLTLTSSIFQPPFARVSRQTMALPLLEDMLLLGCVVKKGVVDFTKIALDRVVLFHSTR
jgi:hypothetical protein